MNKYWYGFLLFLPLTVQAQEGSLTALPDFINRVVENNPEVRASLDKEQRLSQDVRISRSNFMPKLDFQALDTTGFPASTSGLGIGGVMGSPYRVGAAGGFTLEQELWDFGRTSSEVDIAKSRLNAQQFSKESVLEDWKTVAANTYFECARLVATAQVWQDSWNETDRIHKEVLRYVQTGQRSVVDERLALLEVETATRKIESAKIRLNAIQNKARVLMSDPATIRCMGFNDLRSFQVPEAKSILTSPRVQYAKAQIKVAESELSRAKADYMPKLVGFASVGLMDNRRLVNNTDDYSLGIGLTFPIFEGFKTDASVTRADAAVEEKKDLASSEDQQFQLELETLNEAIQASETEVAGVNLELKHAEEALQLAKSRYFKFQGTLLDLREAQRAVVQVKLDLITLLVNYHSARSQKAILSRVL